MNCFSMIIFGATGDLTKKKLMPAIYNLLKKKAVDNFCIVGIARQDISKEKLLKKLKPKKVDAKVWKKLKNCFYYFPLDFYDEKKYEELKLFLKKVELKHKTCRNRLFHLATLPQHFGVISKNLKKHGLARQRGNWTRVVFEKPFGHDLKSARKINKEIKKVFSEKQIYRIDHYLGKELVQNISVVRFTNKILEPLWNRKYIDHIQIILSENTGIKGRGPYYDKYGAIKDVVQNHMMQLLSLVCMESPKMLSGDYIRNEKIKVLKKTKILKTLVGQFSGYHQEKGVKKKSKTETFAALKLSVNNQRWKGVPFYFLTGKRLASKTTLIYFQFKEAPCLLFGKCDFQPNNLEIRIQPNEGMDISLNAKKPGKADIVPVKMDFCHSCLFGPNTPEAYENLFLDVVEGDQSVFIRSDEIEQAWKIIDKIKKGKAHSYRKGAVYGPKESEMFIKKEGKTWHLN